MEIRKRLKGANHLGPEKKKLNRENRQKANENLESNSKEDKCHYCKQFIKDILFYEGHPNNSCAECIALTNETLSLFTGSEKTIHERDYRPIHKITNYSVYDEQGHLCGVDGGLIEDNVLLHMSGFIKPVYEEDCSTNKGIPSHNMGPINEWYIAGFDGGEMAYIGILTNYAEYILTEPSSEYEPIIRNLRQKIQLLKIVIEFLLDFQLEDPTYEDLIVHINNFCKAELSEDFLLTHADFICNQIYSFDKAIPDEDPLINISCVETLIERTDVNLITLNNIKRNKDKILRGKHTDRKATTTTLVKSIFENFFADQMDRTGSFKKSYKKKRCGICDACQLPDCGKCSNCKHMVKFGGAGKSKQACKSRRCTNMDLEDSLESESEDADEEDEIEKIKKLHTSRRIVNKVFWGEKPFLTVCEKEFYKSAIVGDTIINIGDYVMISPDEDNEPLCIAKVQSLLTKHNEPTFHAQVFCRGINTILGETANPQELFAVDICEDCPLGSIVRLAQVELKHIPANWSELGATEVKPPQLEEDSCKFFFTKKYETDTGSFSDYEDENVYNNKTSSCHICIKRSFNKKNENPVLEDDFVKWRNQVYKIGSFIFLNPSAYTFNIKSTRTKFQHVTNLDEEQYPEYYRKLHDTKNSNVSDEPPQPFCVGQIQAISCMNKSNEIKIKVRIFYRPENTTSDGLLVHEKDLNLLYWTKDVSTVFFSNVTGRCYVKYCDISQSPSDWTKLGPYRFYFTEAYNPKTKTFYEVPRLELENYLTKEKGCGKGKWKLAKPQIDSELSPEWNTIERPLRCMDVFSGCGGLSLGLHQAKVAQTLWAIENVARPAEAFKTNNKDCKMFVEDGNKILKQIINGTNNTKFPAKGEVEMIVGGPPCQGFSDMNRFSSRQYSLLKNSLVATLLSFCDYYRPKYFVLENVRNFANFKKSIVLKLTLKCLLEMGYQVTFGILQASLYGLPQSRRRFFLIAAAPGYSLPRFPEPQNVSNRRDYYLPIVVDGIKYTKGNFWTKSAPYRSICVRDAISDLPIIAGGCKIEEMPYDGEPVTSFQRNSRENNHTNKLFDHVCKEMAPIVEERISYIPIMPGSDWRDLPNISVGLRDKTVTNKLHYQYFSKKQSKFDRPRGICPCSIGKGCNPSDRQLNTLIPWCLPHTADRHNNWAGLYGRLDWDELFKTTVTNPEPMGKQGKVIHPEQPRVVSVRECARSQGFPDEFRFFGNVMDKHRQIGNAVPPPLAKAIGIEIINAVSASTNV